MGNSLQALENQYILLTQNLGDMIDACTSQQQKDDINAQYLACRRNYWNNIHKVFHDNDPTVVGLVDQMKTEQGKILDTLKHLNQIAKVTNQGGKALGPGREDLKAMLKIAEGLRDHVKALIRANEVSWENGYAETTH